MQPKPRLTVVSPFIDKRHGTEKCVAEQIERLAGDYEIHLYSERVEDVDLRGIHWHRVPALPGPHLTAYLWWFAANSMIRWWHSKRIGVNPGLVYSPGINCFDADIISVHVVFARFRRQMEKKLRLPGNPISSWPLLIHRRVYYRLIQFLERRIYTRTRFCLVPVSRRIAVSLNLFYQRTENVHVVYYGVDQEQFNPQRRSELRESARTKFGLRENEFAILLIGNDWKSKGLICLMDAVARLRNPAVRILVAGKDDETPFRGLLGLNGLADRVQFLPPRPDVEFYYAAADLYASPSLEDAFALPPLEAMACGLPVIVSRENGGCEAIHHGEDGFILEDPEDAQTLSELIGRLAADKNLCQTVGANASLTAQKITWENNAAGLKEIIEQVRQSGQDLYKGRS